MKFCVCVLNKWRIYLREHGPTFVRRDTFYRIFKSEGFATIEIIFLLGCMYIAVNKKSKIIIATHFAIEIAAIKISVIMTTLKISCKKIKRCYFSDEQKAKARILVIELTQRC